MTAADLPEIAQCETCGGFLEPAGDDWRHQEDMGCTDLGKPALCVHCGAPAAVGGLACGQCAGVFLPATCAVTVCDGDRTAVRIVHVERDES